MACCDTMKLNSMTQDEFAAWQKELERKFGPDPYFRREPPTPLVEWRSSPGCYIIGSIAIQYCPWCGTALPRPTELPYFSFDATGDEQPLTEAEIGVIPFLDRARHSLSRQFETDSLEGELITLSEKHGYIFRYIQRRSETKSNGDTLEVKLGIMLFTKDGDKFTIATAVMI